MLERVAKREAGKSSQKGFKKSAEAHLLKCFERVQLGAGTYPIGGPALASCALCVSTDLAVSELHRSSCIRSSSKPAHNRFECKVISVCHSPTYPRNQGKRKIQKSDIKPLGQISFYHVLLQMREVEDERKPSLG